MAMDGSNQQTLKGYRPSHFSPEVDDDYAAEEIRLANLATYAARAAQGLPLFGDPPKQKKEE